MMFPKTRQVKKKGSEYLRFKLELHELDNWRCKRCNKIKGLTVHHLIKRSHVRLDTFENCLSLCVECHDEVEAGLVRLRFVDVENRVVEVF